MMTLFARTRTALILAVLCCCAAGAQEAGFGFGPAGEDSFEESSGPGAASFAPPLVKIGGEVSAGLMVFTGDLGSEQKVKSMEPGDIFSGKINVTASAANAEAVMNFKLKPVFDGASPVSIDEAYARFYFGQVNIEGGLRKLTWGRADSFGPLDVINPLDYTDITCMADPYSIKIARPMVHLTWNIGSFTRLEAVFVPWFQGHEFAMDGRWAPSEVTGITGLLPGIVAAADPTMQLYTAQKLSALTAAITSSKRNSFEYAQGGIRFTTTAGPADLGVQYYYGRLPRPAVDVYRLNTGLSAITSALPTATTPAAVDAILAGLTGVVDYNWYHHIGADYAQVIAGFNIRSEAGVNLTKDFDGDDGAVYNPHLVWSLGFDRDIFAGINFNLQANERIRLMNNKVSTDPKQDLEAGRDTTSTRVTAILSKKFFLDVLEFKATALWGIEDKDFFIIPSVTWSRNDVSAELSAGFFGGNHDGELGQYWRNHYIKTVLTYSF